MKTGRAAAKLTKKLTACAIRIQAAKYKLEEDRNELRNALEELNDLLLDGDVEEWVERAQDYLDMAVEALSEYL